MPPQSSFSSRKVRMVFQISCVTWISMLYKKQGHPYHTFSVFQILLLVGFSRYRKYFPFRQKVTDHPKNSKYRLTVICCQINSKSHLWLRHAPRRKYSKLMRIVFFVREWYYLRHLLTPRLLANVQIDRYMKSGKDDLF